MIPAGGARRGLAAVTGVVWLAGLLAACAPRVDGPAPVVSSAAAERAPESLTVQRGQTLSEIAQTYHVPMRAIADANGLSPPYRIQVGRRLIIPGAGRPRPSEAPVSVAALPSASPPEAPPAAPVDRPLPAPSDKSSALAEPPSTSPLPSTGDPVAPSAKPAPAAMTPSTAPGAPAPTAPPEPPAAGGAAPPAAHGGPFLWPVRGHVLAAYGSKADGTHNDGINIRAPRGAPVQAADAGVVAYTGNELRGYGNLVLIKHANGWISAYAHCDSLVVKRGEKVVRGQVIARVGSTGNVSEPQLHFELRRGSHPVDPREFLAPLPTAAAGDSLPS